MISEFVEYVKQAWKNKPNVSSPLNADSLNHMEDGIENNSKKIKETVTAVNELTENSAKLHIKQISKTTDNYGQIGTNIPNAHILSAWCNQDLSVVVPLSGTGTGLRVYVANESSQTSDTLRQLTNTAVVINVLYYDFS